MLSLTHTSLFHSLYPNHEPVQSTTLSPCTSYRSQYCALFHWCRNKCEQPSQIQLNEKQDFHKRDTRTSILSPMCIAPKQAMQLQRQLFKFENNYRVL